MSAVAELEPRLTEEVKRAESLRASVSSRGRGVQLWLDRGPMDSYSLSYKTSFALLMYSRVLQSEHKQVGSALGRNGLRLTE